MSAACAPPRLKLAPRPLSAELLSSWLLRVAAANYVTLVELLAGFESRYPDCLPHGHLLDCSLPQAYLEALSFFCRVPLASLQALDIRRRAPHLNDALLLRFRDALWCPRGSRWRVRYAFCPLCLAKQQITHIPWDWCLACVTICQAHRTPLLDGCATCGAPDPLTFAPPDQPPCRACWSCGSDLTQHHGVPHFALEQQSIQTVEDAYRAALLGIAPHPNLLGKATGKSFRRFIDDLMQILTRTLNAASLWPNASSAQTPLLPRPDLLRIITELVLNAAPSSNVQQRRRRYSRSLVLWTTLLKVIAVADATGIEQASQHWPVALRRRYVSALYQRKRKRWPYGPCEGQSLSLRFKCHELSAVFDLTATKRPRR